MVALFQNLQRDVAQIDQRTRQVVGAVKGADLLEAEFRKMGLLYEMDINCRQVGCNP